MADDGAGGDAAGEVGVAAVAAGSAGRAKVTPRTSIHSRIASAVGDGAEVPSAGSAIAGTSAGAGTERSRAATLTPTSTPDAAATAAIVSTPGEALSVIIEQSLGVYPQFAALRADACRESG